ncbi:hypothetical protein H6801_00600 [Candidatus Nomurabacteria bacterium]|nr:hypothetical protein [Candidatus Nomurabacteria bacterium]
MKSIDRIIPFLLEANKAGYANDKPQIEKQSDGTHRIVYERDDFRFEDIWWGGNPFFWSGKYYNWWQSDVGDAISWIYGVWL